MMSTRKNKPNPKDNPGYTLLKPSMSREQKKRNLIAALKEVGIVVKPSPLAETNMEATDPDYKE